MQTHKEVDTLIDTVDRAACSIAQVLGALEPNERARKSETFLASYHDIEAAIARGVTQVEVRKALAQAGLKLSPATFKKLLENERRHQKARDDGVGPANGGGV
jgi:hypothetical protein